MGALRTVRIGALVLAAAAVIGSRAARASDWAPVVTAYLKLHAALVADRIDSVAADAGVVASEAAKLGDAGKPVAEAAEKLARAGDLEAARAVFMEVSEALVTAAGDALPAGVKVAYCPMVKKPWLQSGETIANPYFGSRMPTCGYFKKK